VQVSLPTTQIEISTVVHYLKLISWRKNLKAQPSFRPKKKRKRKKGAAQLHITGNRLMVLFRFY
jgi:hypothetical protein